jgi:ribosomal protein L12E/L44/L45/RPP1/RPP2
MPITVNWSDLEIAFERNSPDQESFLDLENGDLLSIVEGEPDAAARRARVASSPERYLRVDPASSREQYRWMERFIPMVDEPVLRGQLSQAIDGKGAFRRFKDVLIGFTAERERWFAFRSERLRVFMEAWLTAHALHAVPRPTFPQDASSPRASTRLAPEALTRRKGVDALRQQLREVVEGLGSRDLEKVIAFAEFVKARRAARGFAVRPDAQANAGDEASEKASSEEPPTDIDPPSSQQRTAAR